MMGGHGRQAAYASSGAIRSGVRGGLCAAMRMCIADHAAILATIKQHANEMHPQHTSQLQPPRTQSPFPALLFSTLVGGLRSPLHPAALISILTPCSAASVFGTVLSSDTLGSGGKGSSPNYGYDEGSRKDAVHNPWATPSLHWASTSSASSGVTSAMCIALRDAACADTTLAHAVVQAILRVLLLLQQDNEHFSSKSKNKKKRKFAIAHTHLEQAAVQVQKRKRVERLHLPFGSFNPRRRQNTVSTATPLCSGMVDLCSLVAVLMTAVPTLHPATIPSLVKTVLHELWQSSGNDSSLTVTALDVRQGGKLTLAFTRLLLLMQTLVLEVPIPGNPISMERTQLASN